MRTPALPTFVSPPKHGEDYESWATRLVSALTKWVADLSRLINGNVSFGNGTDFDNLKGKWMTVSTAGAGSETTVTHNLGATPVGFLVMKPPASGTVNLGPTAWTTTNLYLSCSAATQTVVIFVLLE